MAANSFSKHPPPHRVFSTNSCNDAGSTAAGFLGMRICFPGVGKVWSCCPSYRTYFKKNAATFRRNLTLSWGHRCLIWKCKTWPEKIRTLKGAFSSSRFNHCSVHLLSPTLLLYHEKHLFYMAVKNLNYLIFRLHFGFILIVMTNWVGWSQRNNDIIYNTCSYCTLWHECVCVSVCWCLCVYVCGWTGRCETERCCCSSVTQKSTETENWLFLCADRRRNPSTDSPLQWTRLHPLRPSVHPSLPPDPPPPPSNLTRCAAQFRCSRAKTGNQVVPAPRCWPSKTPVILNIFCLTWTDKARTNRCSTNFQHHLAR